MSENIGIVGIILGFLLSIMTIGAFAMFQARKKSSSPTQKIRYINIIIITAVLCSLVFIVSSLIIFLNGVDSSSKENSYLIVVAMLIRVVPFIAIVLAWGMWKKYCIRKNESSKMSVKQQEKKQSDSEEYFS